MKKLHVIAPVVATAAFAALFYWMAAPNPWRTADYTTGRDSQCEVHHVRMERKKVKIRYGLVRALPWFEKHARAGDDFTSFHNAEKEKFPHAREVILGECVITGTSPESAYIYVCPRCVEACAAHQQEGFSIERAIKLPAPTMEAGVRARHEWLAKNMPLARYPEPRAPIKIDDENEIVTFDRMMMGNEKGLFYAYAMQFTDGSIRNVYFDISEYFGKSEILGTAGQTPQPQAASDGEKIVVTTPIGRKEQATRQYTLKEIEDGTASNKPEPDDPLDDPFTTRHPVYPQKQKLEDLKKQFKDGDQIWYFEGLDSGWVIVRNGVNVWVLVTSHDY